MNNFSERLKLLLKESKYTQKQVADLIGITEAALSRYMTSERIPRPKILANLATALGTTTDYLLYGTDKYQDFSEIKGILARYKGDITTEQKKDLLQLINEINIRLENE